MYATTPHQLSPPTCSTTTTKHLYPLPLTISPFAFSDICSKKSNFNNLCTDDIIDSNESKHNLLNNNNNNKILNGDSLDPSCLFNIHDQCNRSIYDFLNSHDKLNSSNIINKIDPETIKENHKKSQESINQTKDFKLGKLKSRHFILIIIRLNRISMYHKFVYYLKNIQR